MKTIYDLTSEEIANLTDEDVGVFIDIECAMKGPRRDGYSGGW